MKTRTKIWLTITVMMISTWGTPANAEYMGKLECNGRDPSEDATYFIRVISYLNGEFETGYASLLFQRKDSFGSHAAPSVYMSYTASFDGKYIVLKDIKTEGKVLQFKLQATGGPNQYKGTLAMLDRNLEITLLCH